MKILNAYYKFAGFLKILKFKMLFGKQFIHGKISFRRRFNILIEKEGKLEIGSGCFFNNDCSITCMNKISIGENSIFGEGVKIYDHNYHINSENLIKQSGHKVGEVRIGNNCWIGSSVIILKGATIGNNCVIGAGCIINSIVDDNKLVMTSFSDIQRITELKSKISEN